MPPPFHGSAVMTQTLLSALTRLGVEHRLVDRRFSRTIAEVGSFRLRKLSRAAATAAELVVASRRFRPTIVIYFIATSLGALAVDAVLLKVLRSLGLRCWLYFHGRGYREAAARSRATQRIVTTALANATGGIVLSDLLIPDIDEWIPRARLLVIPNAIEDIPPDACAGRPHREIIRFLFLSNLIPSKGGMEFVEAAIRLLAHSTSCEFRIFGEPQDARFAAALDERASCLGGRLLRGGGVYGLDKVRAFAESDVFVFPTYYEFETFGLVNLEAMRASLPVIATDVGAIPDVVRHGVTGYIVPPRDIDALAAAMGELAASSEKRTAMGREGRNLFLQNFTLERFDARWSEALGRMREMGA